MIEMLRIEELPYMEIVTQDMGLWGGLGNLKDSFWDIDIDIDFKKVEDIFMDPDILYLIEKEEQEELLSTMNLSQQNGGSKSWSMPVCVETTVGEFTVGDVKFTGIELTCNS